MKKIQMIKTIILAIRCNTDDKHTHTHTHKHTHTHTHSKNIMQMKVRTIHNKLNKNILNTGDRASIKIEYVQVVMT